MPNHAAGQQGEGDGWSLRCDKCHRTTDFLPEDVLSYSRDGWPQCCGGMMDILKGGVRLDMMVSPDDFKPPI